MRVVCIDDTPGDEDDSQFPPIKKGRIYHPTRKVEIEEREYYALAECGPENGYRVDCFQEIEEDQSDETEYPYHQRALVPRTS